MNNDRRERCWFSKVGSLHTWSVKTEVLDLREQEPSCWHPVMQRRVRDRRNRDTYRRKRASARTTFQYWEIFPTGANLLLWKKTKYPLSLWEFLSSLKGPQIWENFFPLLSTCTYDVSKILLSLLSQGISQLSLIIRHIFIHGLWGLISTFWTTECNPKNWILNFSPRKEDKSFTGNWISKWVQTSVRVGSLVFLPLSTKRILGYATNMNKTVTVIPYKSLEKTLWGNYSFWKSFSKPVIFHLVQSQLLFHGQFYLELY